MDAGSTVDVCGVYTMDLVLTYTILALRFWGAGGMIAQRTRCVNEVLVAFALHVCGARSVCIARVCGNRCRCLSCVWVLRAIRYRMRDHRWEIRKSGFFSLHALK